MLEGDIVVASEGNECTVELLLLVERGVFPDLLEAWRFASVVVVISQQGRDAILSQNGHTKRTVTAVFF